MLGKTKRLGRGIEDISHYFISQDQKRREQSSIIDVTSQFQTVSIVDLFDPHRGALLTAKISTELCRNGVRTLLIDTDIRFPSIAFILGRSLPGYSLRHYLQNQYQPSDIIYTGPFGLKVLAPHLSIKDIYSMKILDIYMMLDTLITIEKEVDIIILRQYEAILRPLIDEAIFVIPAANTSIIRAYRTIKAFTAGGERKGIGIIISEATDEITATKVYKKIYECTERFCGIKPYSCGNLPDVSNTSSIISHIVKGVINKSEGAINKRLFFERLRYLMGTDQLMDEEIKNLLS